MPRTTLFAALVLLSAIAPLAQTPAAAPQSASPTIQARTNLVIEDVVVTDRAGNPVHGLTRADFAVFEKGKPEQIRSFDEHAAQPPTPFQPPLPLPPGVFTNYAPAPPSPAYDILLLDTLNTALEDQGFVRQQVLKYLQTAPRGQRIAIFGLTTHLLLLQGFTSDPAILRSAMDRKSMRSSDLLDNASVGGSAVPSSNLAGSSGAIAEAAANTQQFEADTATFQVQVRARYTLDALGTLARYLSVLPGRKNVIWFSGSFPLNIFPDATLKDPFRATIDLSSDLRDTSTLLTHARVAIYPIDARGLFNDPTYDASNSGQELFRPGGSMAAMQRFGQQTAAEHATMLDLARQTGGHAFINTNGLAEAVARATEQGSNFYTIAYTPADSRLDNTFRPIEIKLAGARAGTGLNLAYRRGYFAVDPDATSRRGLPSTSTPSSAPPSGLPISSGTPLASLPSAALRTAMPRGAPPATDLIFKAKVVPATSPAAPPETVVAPGNQPDPKRTHAPFRNYVVDFAAFPSQLLARNAAGNYVGSIRFLTLAYTAEGEVINLVDQTAAVDLTPERYAATVHGGILYREVISLPSKGEYFLRIGVLNLNNDRAGSLEVPLVAIKDLPPAPPSAPSSPPHP